MRRKPKVRIKRTKTSLGWAYRIYVDGMYMGTALTRESVRDLPVQAATKFETALNLKTAKALGLKVPAALLVAADDVIE